MSQRNGVKAFLVKTRRVWFGTTALLCAGLCGLSVNAQDIAKVRWHYAYHIGVGDILEISVSERPELSGVVVVSESGEVSMPWHKAFKVGGLSVEGRSYSP
jgi:protein involved in polysaccharide export with SLBB domain